MGGSDVYQNTNPHKSAYGLGDFAIGSHGIFYVQLLELLASSMLSSFRRATVGGIATVRFRFENRNLTSVVYQP
jgi:hypothetical protein